MSIFRSGVRSDIGGIIRARVGRRMWDVGIGPYHLRPSSYVLLPADYNHSVPEPLVSVVIASDRVRESLPDCLASLAAQEDAPGFEVLVASAFAPPPLAGDPYPLRWTEVAARTPARRRNRAAREARGLFLAFLDDDAA